MIPKNVSKHNIRYAVSNMLSRNSLNTSLGSYIRMKKNTSYNDVLTSKYNLRTYSSTKIFNSKIISPREIYHGLQEHIVGQHKVKIAVSVGVHNHLMRSSILGTPKSSTSSTDHSSNPNIHELGEFVDAELDLQNLTLGRKSNNNNNNNNGHHNAPPGASPKDPNDPNPNMNHIQNIDIYRKL
jgi:hypothetical protein